MQVRPQDEERERERHPPRRPPALRGEQAEQHHEEELREELRTEDRREVEDRHERERHDARRGGAAATREHERERDRREEQRDRREQREADSTDAEDLPERELREPLLVDHVLPERHQRDGVPVRDPVLDDLAAPDDRHPAVVAEQRSRRDRPEEDECRAGGDEDALRGEEVVQPSRHARARRCR